MGTIILITYIIVNIILLILFITSVVLYDKGKGTDYVRYNREHFVPSYCLNYFMLGFFGVIILIVSIIALLYILWKRKISL